MWKLWHAVFGIHFVGLQFGYGIIVRRVRSAPNGQLYVKAYGDMIFLDDKSERFNPLTWDPKKEVSVPEASS